MAIRERAAFRESLDEVLLWDFERVIVGHGEKIAFGGRSVLREAFSFLE
jgi:hypothetical protein